LSSDAEALGILDQDRTKMFAEAIDVILAIWEREPPYNIDFENNRFKVSTQSTMVAEIGRGILMKPYQSPHPEIVGTVVAPFSKGVIAMGQRDFHPMSANFLLSHWLPRHWSHYQEGKAKVGSVAHAGGLWVWNGELLLVVTTRIAPCWMGLGSLKCWMGLGSLKWGVEPLCLWSVWSPLCGRWMALAAWARSHGALRSAMTQSWMNPGRGSAW
jgi:hypothetical protein